MIERALKGKKILITSGPTREYLDPVRFISNDSSGVMGAALASAAQKLGGKVTIVFGPSQVATPSSVTRVNIVSADEMFAAVKRESKKADIIICAAAVADFKPAKFIGRKIKKSGFPSKMSLSLLPTPDILAWLGANKRNGQFIVGFALETEALIKNARKKLFDKRCDAIVANLSSSIGSKNTDIFFLTPSSEMHVRGSKSAVAEKIVKQLTCLYK